MSDELVLNVGADARQEKAFVSRATDPVVSNVSTPGDFAAQYPTPLDTTEIITMCEEVNMWRFLPEKITALKEETYRAMDALAFTSGSSYIAFTDGACPEEYSHSGNNTTISLKNIGAKKSLTISDIMHSAAIAAAGWNGINRMVGGWAAGEGMPGGADAGTFLQQSVADLKAKEMLLASTLVLNGWDRLLVLGNAASNALEFSGIEVMISGTCAHTNAGTTSATGTFGAAAFDRFLSESCAKPDTIAGSPQAIQEMLSSYFQLGFAGSQVINATSGDRIIPGFNFAGEVFTGVGRLKVVADANFTRTDVGGGAFQSSLFALRMRHNGEPLIYKITQIPLAFKDLAPGCTAISFQVWAKTALIIKACCAQSRYQSWFTGRIVTTCTRIG